MADSLVVGDRLFELLKSHCSSLSVPTRRETRLQRLLRNYCYELSVPPKPGRGRLRILLGQHCSPLEIPDTYYGEDWSDGDSDASTLVGSDYCPSLISDTGSHETAVTSAIPTTAINTTAPAAEEIRAFERRQGITDYRSFIVQPWTENDIFN
jgi:hypothetical protein